MRKAFTKGDSLSDKWISAFRFYLSPSVMGFTVSSTVTLLRPQAPSQHDDAAIRQILARFDPPYKAAVPVCSTSSFTPLSRAVPQPQAEFVRESGELEPFKVGSVPAIPRVDPIVVVCFCLVIC